MLTLPFFVLGFVRNEYPNLWIFFNIMLTIISESEKIMAPINHEKYGKGLESRAET